VMNSGGDLERVAYSRVRRLWAARVAMVCVLGVGCVRVLVGCLATVVGNCERWTGVLAWARSVFQGADVRDGLVQRKC
jgi:hypothetical protein